MFNQTLRNLSKCKYILVVENGICKLMDKDSRTIHLIFPANTSAKEKQTILQEFHHNNCI